MAETRDKKIYIGREPGRLNGRYRLSLRPSFYCAVQQGNGLALVEGSQ
jgi:hypothetical protein